jgi:hypothetical protein
MTIEPPRLARLGLTGVLALAVLGITIGGLGCGPRYPKVTSKENLTLVLALRTACSTEDPARLEKVEKALQRAAGEGKLTEAERTALERIIAMARKGEWKRAERACYSFSKAQLN